MSTKLKSLEYTTFNSSHLLTFGHIVKRSNMFTTLLRQILSDKLLLVLI